ncbi:DUF6879 family protein [Nocardiopsis sp. ATB16-24]|uniref:DUF6879 family protein n=1 Tax=Nocardiopsis sp. ATB16-24 TaxID=3019555 RepID=UPI0025533D42|nr:DUF6879 family protein [Nocardiopsis sp. ATB16-24]
MGRFLSEEEFSQQFTDFEHSAWKLEVRDRYNVPEEAETIRRFLTDGDLGRGEDHARTSPWHRNVTATTHQGKIWQRVRVVSEPLSDYIAWEHAVTRFNIEAGEDIRWLPRHHPTARELPDLDFWLFDESWACVLHFDADDVPQKLERLGEPEEIARLLRWRDLAWEHAIPHREFTPRGSGRFNT